MIFIEIVQYSLAAVAGVLLGYRMVLSMFALKGTKVSILKATRNRKFAIVLPDEDEEKRISRTLYSLSGLVYPKNMYDLIVAVDDGTDKSALLAQKLGAKVLERPSKSNVDSNDKRWIYDRIMHWDETYDAILVFESGSLISGNYLEVMNYYLGQGREVIQSSDLVLPQPDKWSIEALRIGFLLKNYVNPLGRKAMGLGTQLRGNGMCFSTEVLRRMPADIWSLKENEQSIELHLEGVDIKFAPEASVWREMSEMNKEGAKSRVRKRGHHRKFRKYVFELIADVFRQSPLKSIDKIIELATPSLINMQLFVIAMCLVNVFSWTLGWVSLSFFWTWLIIAGFGMVHLFVGLLAAQADRQLYKAILFIPLYALEKVKTYFEKLFWKEKDQFEVQANIERSEVISTKLEEF